MQKSLPAVRALGILLIIGAFTFAAVWVLLGNPPAQRATGLAAGVTTLNVSTAVLISLPQNVVDFGTTVQGSSNNTTDDMPPPFTVRNDGNILLDISVKANSFLFSGFGSGNNTDTFRFMAGNVSTEPNTFNWSGSITSFTNFTDTAQTVISAMNFSNSSDETEVEVLINVPTDEPAGNKTADVIFTATQS